MTTTYGTIPTSTQPGEDPPSPFGFLSRAKDRGRTALAARRPWKELIHRHAFSLPAGAGAALARARTNLAYFAANYAIVALSVVFFSLLWHPISLIVFFVMLALWLFLYFLRDEPLVLFRRTVGDGVVAVVLAVVTVVALLFTGATVNVVSAVAVAAVVVLLHAVLRRTEDLGVGEGGWYTVVGGEQGPSSLA